MPANPIPQQDDDLIKAFSLFDLTVSSAGNSNTTTFFIPPILKIPQKFGHIKIDGLSIVLDTRQNPFIGKTLKYRATSKPGALWNDSPWHPTYTGEHSKGGSSIVSWIYK